MHEEVIGSVGHKKDQKVFGPALGGSQHGVYAGTGSSAYRDG
jgi:hypothetical protein